MNNRANTYNILDLRQIIKSLITKAYWILGAATVAALIAWLVSAFLIPKRYQSTAIVFITPVGIHESLESEGEILLNVPEIDQLATLVQSQNIVGRLDFKPLEDIRVEASENEKVENSTRPHDTVQLSLMATANTAQRSAELANRWAEAFLTYLSEQYGAESVYAQLEQSLSEKLPDYEAYESDGMDNVLGGQKDVLAARLSRAQQALERDLAAIEQCQALREDIETFHWQEQPEDSWTLEQEIMLAVLYQRAAVLLSDGQGSYPVQVFSQQGDSVTQTGEMLTTLDQLLEEKQAALEAGLETRQAAIVYLGTRLEASTNGQVAQLAIRATPPAQPLGLSPGINASLAGFLALMLAGLVVVFLEWWRVPEQDVDK
jgi:capsular polysaccharide biosynthesis protein